MPKKKRRLFVRTTILLVLLAAVIYTIYGSITKDKPVIAVGEYAYDFVLTDMDGNQHRLSDYRGQGVFINFWGTWCKPCEKEMPYINNQYKEYKDQGVQVLAINIGEPVFLIEKFLNKHDLDFPILRDSTKDVSAIYDIYNLPATILVDPEGKIVEIVEGALNEGQIKGMMERIKP